MAEQAAELDPMVAFYFGLDKEEKPEEEIQETPEEPVSIVEEPEAVQTTDEPVTPKAEEQVVIQKWEDSITDPNARWIADTLAKENGEEEVYNAIKDKFEYKSYTPEQKVLSYLAAQNPELDENEILFMAGQEYGIGVDIDPNDPELTPDEKKALRIRDINRKKAVSEADKFFSEKSKSITLPSLPNPLDNDEGYKEYQNYKTQQQEIQKQQEAQQKEIDAVLAEIDTTAKSFKKLDIDLKFDLDGGEFAIKSDFKMDEQKQKQLADYAKRYQPSAEEVKAFTDPNGKFDMKGYMDQLANQCFAKQLIKAAVKQALSKDRERFVENDLYNNKLRNNEISESTTITQEPWEYLMGR